MQIPPSGGICALMARMEPMETPPNGLGDRPPTRVLVGGIGLPWLRDLDFGTQFLKRIADEEWPDDVALEDLSYSAHRVLHTLQDLRPEKVVLVGAMPRDVDPPGTIRRYKLDLTPPDDEEVADRLGEAVGGIIDLDHTLAVVVALSPKATLQRGYAVVQDADGHVVRDPGQVAPGDALRVRVAEGEVAATVR